MTYYNDSAPDVCQWLRALIDAGELPEGTVDERGIKEIEPDDVRGYEQVHLFAGIGGWPLALRWAGWSGPVWTGSCPCQPFSVAGRRGGTGDARHLWPEMFRLVRQRIPATIVGEQVASPAGRRWLAGVFADLEGVGYAVAGADLCAAGVGAPHIRQRLFWLAHADDARREGPHRTGEPGEAAEAWPRTEYPGGNGGLDDADQDGREPGRLHVRRGRQDQAAGVEQGHPEGMGNPDVARLEGQRGDGDGRDEPGRIGAEEAGHRPASAWDDHEVVWCNEPRGMVPRRIGRLPEPVADGVPGGLGPRGRIRGYGNAVVPQLAATFLRAVMEIAP